MKPFVALVFIYIVSVTQTESHNAGFVSQQWTVQSSCLQMCVCVCVCVYVGGREMGGGLGRGNDPTNSLFLDATRPNS